MKNVRKSVLLSLVSLALISCGSTESTTPTPDTGTSSATSEKASASDTGRVSESTSTDSTSDVTSDSSAKPNPDSDTGIEPDTDADAWGDDISELMTKHLGGNILPYVSLGRTVDGTWKRSIGDYGILTIVGGKFDKKYLDDALTAFEAKGWTVDKTATTFTGTESDKHLKVELTSDEYGYAKMTAVYDEPFDATSVDSWDSDTLSAMQSNLGGHVLPFIYLGMTAPSYEWTNSTKTFAIEGGKWDDSVLDLAVASMTAASFENVKKTSEVYGTVVSGDLTFDDGCKVSVSLYKSGSDTAPYPHLSVFYKEAYNPVDGATWPTSISSRFQSSFDNHELPYIYLGSNTLSSDWNPTTNKLTITGGAFDSRMFDSARTTLSAEGYSLVDEKDSSGNQKALIASSQLSDGCTIVAVLFGNSTLARLDVYYYSPLNVPEGSTSFSDDEAVKAKMDKYLDGHSGDIPFVYLGTDTLDVSYDTYSESLQIVGDKFNGVMIDRAKKAFEDAGYGIAIGSDDSYGRTFYASKKMSDGCVITARMDSSYGTKSALLTLSCVEGFNPPEEGSEEAAWSATIEEAMEVELGGNVIPFIYLGTKSVSLKQSSNTIELTGGSWNDSILTSAKTALETMEDFTWTFKDGIDRVDGEASDEDGNKLTVALYKNSKSKPVLKITYLKAFVVPEDGEWSEDIKSTMTANFGEVLPYVYLATTEPDAGDFYAGELEIYGGTWDDQIYDLAETAFTEAGYMLSNGVSQSDDGDMVTAYKTVDGKLIRIAVYSYDGTATYKACFTDAATYPSDVTSWASDIQSLMTSYMGEDHAVPYFYTGDNTPSSTLKSYSAIGKKYLQVSSLRNWNENYTLNAKNVLEAAGWSTTYYAISDQNYAGSKLVANYTYSDGASVILTIKYGYSYDTMYIAYQDPFEPGDSTTWSPTATNIMETNLNGHILPYFYMGTDSPDVAFDRSYHCMTMVGGIWNESIYSLAETALKADTDLSWTVVYDYSFSDSIEGKTLVAVADEPETGKHFTLKLYCQTSGTRNGYGVQAPVLEVYYN